jgi:CoA:oxalate CoA-transferase
VKRARERGAPVSRVNDLTDFLADPHVQANATVFEAEDAQAERLRMLRPAPRFGETRSQLRRNPPRLGEHSDEILREIGCSPGEIDRLRAAGVVR